MTDSNDMEGTKEEASPDYLGYGFAALVGGTSLIANIETSETRKAIKGPLDARLGRSKPKSVAKKPAKAVKLPQATASFGMGLLFGGLALFGAYHVGFKPRHYAIAILYCKASLHPDKPYVATATSGLVMLEMTGRTIRHGQVTT